MVWLSLKRVFAQDVGLDDLDYLKHFFTLDEESVRDDVKRAMFLAESAQDESGILDRTPGEKRLRQWRLELRTAT